MSWSTTLERKPWDGLKVLNKSNVDEVPEHREQYKAAIGAVNALLMVHINSIGGFDKTYRIILTGHGNPGHEPTEGWANDFISITITQVSEEK